LEPSEKIQKCCKEMELNRCSNAVPTQFGQVAMVRYEREHFILLEEVYIYRMEKKVSKNIYK
jgi:hypothetical protein